MSDPSATREEQIIRSWHVNAEPWARAVGARSIASRKLVTDQAIINAVLSVAPQRVLDLGCGEGWLARALSAHGIHVLGIDVVAELIAEAKRQGGGDFEVLSYDDVGAGPMRGGTFDTVVCNFSLLGRESVESLLSAIKSCLEVSGHLIVQTLHPLVACGAEPYRDGWRTGSWTGFPADFSEPAPWYFRTVAGWCAMLARCGFVLTELLEPTAPDGAAPSSIIYMCIQCDALRVTAKVI